MVPYGEWWYKISEMKKRRKLSGMETIPNGVNIYKLTGVGGRVGGFVGT